MPVGISGIVCIRHGGEAETNGTATYRLLGYWVLGRGVGWLGPACATWIGYVRSRNVGGALRRHLYLQSRMNEHAPAIYERKACGQKIGTSLSNTVCPTAVGRIAQSVFDMEKSIYRANRGSPSQWSGGDALRAKAELSIHSKP
jgi:hypothetical protein